MNSKRIVLMSLKEKPYEKILAGKKPYEFRTRYVKGETIAFIYVTGKVKKVKGIIYFDKPIVGRAEEISQLSEDINPGSYPYMMEYFKKGTGYAIPVKKIVEIEPISLDKLRKSFEGFVVPQSYYYLDMEEKRDLLEVIKKLGNVEVKIQ